MVLEFLKFLNDELTVIAVAAAPVLELRGSIPMGIAMGLDWKLVYMLSIIGNLIPVPFIIYFMRPLFSFLRKKPFFNNTISYLENRTRKKSETVMKYSALGLFLLVFIPFPGTGAWTGSMVAALLDLRLKYALPAIILGVLGAGFLVTVLSLHII